ncbi:HhoA/HhoB/HtrA family serine endopeptidase [Myxacorys almedinensis]|uniref:PDZ domain-containing protein n=1 Tax=Myxacorys almedinensis A TaxID=2690445 RepID=A0A8J7YXD3_9CYAN|nr:HhoA/HhoB/HtrA family serine endopeptidase [Myxacorys almedinensis]NDJ16334.1 PDZ domain-containing protein [Myxacorys almedinensis A]
MKPSFKPSVLFLSFLIGTPLTSCAAIGDLNRVQEPPQATPTQQPALPQGIPSQTPTTAAIPNNLSAVMPVVEQVGPAVVRINSTRTVRESVNEFDIDQFFGRRRPRQEQIQRGTGSGFITSANGQVITNAHVVEGADNVTVILRDGRRYPGKVLGADPLSDVAVIQIDATNLPIVRLGNSDQLVPGQLAIAIGNPLGLSNTVTQGIISATERSTSDIGIPDKRINFIQTDAAINPGNSGGPLLNGAGEVIGVNTAIIQGAQGLGFAIPINTVQKIAQQLATTGRVEYPYIGVQMTELTPELRSQINQSNLGFQVKQTEGIVVLKVLPNSPAAQAGLRPGDVIASVNGAAIENTKQVQQQVDATGINNSMQITVNRNGQTQQLTIRPQALPEQNAQ